MPRSGKKKVYTTLLYVNCICEILYIVCVKGVIVIGSHNREDHAPRTINQ